MFKRFFESIRKKIAFYRKKRRLEIIIEKYKWTHDSELQEEWYEAYVAWCALTQDPRIIYNGSTWANMLEWEKGGSEVSHGQIKKILEAGNNL